MIWTISWYLVVTILTSLTLKEKRRKQVQKVIEMIRGRSNRERRVLYDDMDDFVVSGSDDSDESYTKRKKKKASSKSYRDDSWDSEVTSEEDYRKKKSVKKSKSSKNKKSNSRSKSKPKSRRYSEDSDVEFESTKIDRKNIIEDDEEEDDVGRRNRKTRGKRTKYNLILDDSSESEAEKAKGAGKQIKNCIIVLKKSTPPKMKTTRKKQV